jgi:CDP-2,3-bis-(O-geranylgeranyl)-sn-glycerol synthase
MRSTAAPELTTVQFATGRGLRGTADMGTFDLLVIGKVLFLLTMANAAPLIGKTILSEKMANPIDCGLILKDGQPLFGKSKTIRGIVLALFATTILAPLVGIEFATGTIISAAAMVGDLFSSFLKRRLRMPPGSMAIGLDQIPEALLPALMAKCVLPLTVLDVTATVFVFFIGNSSYRAFLR